MHFNKFKKHKERLSLAHYFTLLGMNRVFIISILFIITFSACNSNKKEEVSNIKKKTKTELIIDCHYTLKEAIYGSKAPKFILNELQLIDVQYYSTDGKVHKGQILTNKKLANKIEILFRFILLNKFPIAHAIPIVKYNWNDDLSMQANNTYSFCYRDISYSKHARGMAIDINPFFNPVRWKTGYENRRDEPIGAHYNPKTPGTFYSRNPVVQEFKKYGFRWGHSFTAKYDDHHFELQ